MTINTTILCAACGGEHVAPGCLTEWEGYPGIAHDLEVVRAERDGYLKLLRSARVYVDTSTTNGERLADQIDDVLVRL